MWLKRYLEPDALVAERPERVPEPDALVAASGLSACPLQSDVCVKR